MIVHTYEVSSDINNLFLKNAIRTEHIFPVFEDILLLA